LASVTSALPVSISSLICFGSVSPVNPASEAVRRGREELAEKRRR